MNKQSFYFHDYETFGINPALDKPAQFAGIRTDTNLNIISEPLILYCKPPLDYLPDPKAVLITGITPQLALTKGVCEAEFAKLIHKEFSYENSCIVGYNNIRFDDEVTRNIFYRNFHDPYEYSYKNNNSRWDLLDVVRACYTLRPQGINWPVNNKGVVSFKLEDLTLENDIQHESAHDAMSDVYATIDIAKLIKNKQPKLFNYFFSKRNKNEIIKLINLNECTPLVHISGMLGSYRANATLISPIMWHSTNPNAIIVCDLMGDINSLIQYSAETIKEKLYTKSENLVENESRIPLKLIHINKCPIVAPSNTLTDDAIKRIGLDINFCEKNLSLLKSNHLIIKKKLNEIFIFDNKDNQYHDVDNQIYEGFFNNNDKNLCQIIKETQKNHLNDLIITPTDKRITELFKRYKARNYPELLTKSEHKKWLNYCRHKLSQDVIKNYLAGLEKLAFDHQNDDHKYELLNNLYLYCKKITDAIY